MIAYRNHFAAFYKDQDEKVQSKIEYILDLIRFERQVPTKFLKYLENSNGIYEVRVKTTFKNIRILCFFDDGNLVVLINSFVKKLKKNTKI